MPKKETHTAPLACRQSISERCRFQGLYRNDIKYGTLFTVVLLNLLAPIHRYSHHV